ncbi:MAG: hypothetical protein ACI4NP_05750 [Thermoguttaceae bacterium]
MKNSSIASKRPYDVNRRQLLRGAACLALLVPTLCATAGCQTMKDLFSGSNNDRKESKTIDDVMTEKRPEW